ncbi:hypothetical protein CEP54_001530 [Fusarium duplospermum]|uniref:DEAD/DEAH-box helicase domain-containing protein n=1 Tax=Fusarium duplospermum TaxID=1325734 RepID=A0A428R0D5_9HYPO|nr:hypothetical protein CEP54_001530 [Fusarium duplospermum]
MTLEEEAPHSLLPKILQRLPKGIRLFGQGELGTMRSREELRRVSIQWHRFFGFGAEDGNSRRVGRAGRYTAEAVRPFTPGRHDGPVGADGGAGGQVQGIAGTGDPRRGPGRVADHADRADGGRRYEKNTAALPIQFWCQTGGVFHCAWGDGKSLTFMMPTYCTPDGVTVVVTPLVSLENDMAVRCAKIGIDAYVWKSGGVKRAASLVFVTPESAVSKVFRALAERMHGQEKLDRVVVDECHGVAAQQDIPAAERAVGADVAGFRGGGGVFDSDVEADAGEGVFPSDAFYTGAGADVPGGDDAAEYTVQSRRDRG